MPFEIGVLIGNIFGFILAIPVALFLAFWMSAVKNKVAVVAGALLGGLIGFAIVLFWVSTLHNVNGAAIFFGALLFNATLALVAGIVADLLIAGRNERHYRRIAHEEGH